MSINIQTENNELKKIAGTYGTDNTSHVTIDSELSTDSENPIQNKVIAKELNDLDNTIGTIKLTSKYVTEHDTLSSFIDGLKNNTCYSFCGTNGEIYRLNKIGLSPVSSNTDGIGNIKLLYMPNHKIIVTYISTKTFMTRTITFTGSDYALSDWYSFVTTEDNVNHATSAENADTVDGYHVNDSAIADPRGKIPIVKDDGVMEVGKYIDFHVSTADWDNDARITADYDKMEINKPIESPGIKTSSLTVSKSFSGYGEPQFVVENPTYPSAKVIGYVDQEGANFRLQCNEGNNYFEFDTLGNSLRLYHYYDGATPTLISSVGSGANLELQIARATKDSDGNVIKDTYAKKSELGSGGTVSGAYLPSIDGNTNYIKNTDRTKLIIGLGNSSVHPVIMQGYGPIGLADNHGSIANGILVESGQVTPRSFIETDKRPGVHGAMNLGSSGYAWDAIYSKTGITTTSDKNMKNSITEIDLSTVEHLIEKVLTYTYKLNDGESGRTHYGMIAQQLEEVLNELGIDSKDFAAFIKSPVVEDIFGQAKDEEGNLLYDDNGEPIIAKIGEKETGEYIHMIRYGELIPILWKNAQDKNRKIERLQNSNEELNNKVVNLEERIAKLESYINIKDTIDAEGRFQ